MKRRAWLMLRYNELLERRSAQLRLSELIGRRGEGPAIVRANTELAGKVSAV